MSDNILTMPCCNDKPVTLQRVKLDNDHVKQRNLFNQIRLVHLMISANFSESEIKKENLKMEIMKCKVIWGENES